MRRPKFSLVCSSGGLKTWDWSSSRQAGPHAARLTELMTMDGARTVLLAPYGTPFGWLAAPDRTVQAVFAFGTDGWSFDWLDFCGAVQDARYEAKRLGSHAHETHANVTVPGFRDRGGRDVLARAPGAQSPFSPWRGGWESGQQFICGPFLLEVV
jgi:hypothetical protein